MRRRRSDGGNKFGLPSTKTILWTSVIAVTVVLLYQRNTQFQSLVNSTLGKVI